MPDSVVVALYFFFLQKLKWVNKTSRALFLYLSFFIYFDGNTWREQRLYYYSCDAPASAFISVLTSAPLGWASKSCKMSSGASLEFMLFFSTFFRKVVLLTDSTQRGSYHCCASGLTFVNCVRVDVEDQLSGTLWCLRRNLQTFLPDVKKKQHFHQKAELSSSLVFPSIISDVFQWSGATPVNTYT